MFMSQFPATIEYVTFYGKTDIVYVNKLMVFWQWDCLDYMCVPNKNHKISYNKEVGGLE